MSNRRHYDPMARVKKGTVSSKTGGSYRLVFASQVLDLKKRLKIEAVSA